MKNLNIVQGVVYSRGVDGLNFLIVKRVPSDGGFWQAITGTIEPGEEPLTTLKRELVEEAGLNDLIHVSDLLETYKWSNETVSGIDSVFAIEVRQDVQIILEPSEHDMFKWLLLEDAIKMLKYDGNKLSMRAAAFYANSLS